MAAAGPVGLPEAVVLKSESVHLIGDYVSSAGRARQQITAFLAAVGLTDNWGTRLSRRGQVTVRTRLRVRRW